MLLFGISISSWTFSPLVSLMICTVIVPTGNGKKLSNSQACCLAAAQFLSISCGQSYVRRLYRSMDSNASGFGSAYVKNWPNSTSISSGQTKKIEAAAEFFHRPFLSVPSFSDSWKKHCQRLRESPPFSCHFLYLPKVLNS